MLAHITVNALWDVVIVVVNIYMYFYLSSLLRSFLGTIGFVFAAAAIFWELHLTPSMSNVQVFSLLTTLVILSRTNICAKEHLSLVQTLSFFDPLTQICISLPPTVTFGGWLTLSGFFMDLKYNNLFKIKILIFVGALTLCMFIASFVRSSQSSSKSSTIWINGIVVIILGSFRASITWCWWQVQCSIHLKHLEEVE